MAYRHIDGRVAGSRDVAPGLVSALARFLVALHAIDPAGKGIDCSTFPDRASVDAERREAMEIALPWLRGRVPPTVHTGLESWWDRYQEFRVNEPFRPAIVHGDFWYGNLLLTNDGTHLTGVLDWEQVALDDPAQDYATLLHSGPQLADQVLAAACGHSGQDPEPLRRRRGWHWGYREFSGLAMSIVAGNIAEAEESLGKLHTGALQHMFRQE
jgi:aminoglycoside phosphotransferase (APT) family kinase protein